MDADGDFEGCRQLVGQFFTELVDLPDDRRRRLQCLTIGLFRRRAKAEQRHGAIADELVYPAAIFLDNAADDGKIAIEEENDVEWQARFRQRCEMAEIAEEDDNLTFAARTCGLRIDRDRRLRHRRQQRHDADIARRAQLAGKSDIRRCANPVQGLLLQRLRRRQVFGAFDNLHAAGRALPLAAADRIMRNAAKAACFKHAVTARGIDDLAACIADGDLILPLPQSAMHPKGEKTDERQTEGTIKTGAIRPYGRRHLIARHGTELAETPHVAVVTSGIAALVFLRDFMLHGLAHRGKAEQGENRQNDCKRQHDGGNRCVPGAIAQPEMNSDAAVKPDDHKHDRLAQAAEGPNDPQIAHDRLVGVVVAIDLVDDARRNDVVDQEERYQQSGEDLKGFPRRHDQGPSPIEHSQHEQDMEDQRPVKKHGSDRIAPYGHEPMLRAFRRAERNQP